MNRRGFTLTEMLLALGVIGVLFSILVPSFLSAMAVGRRTVCATNLRQIDVAFRARALAISGAAVIRPFPERTEWPSVPYDTVPNTEMFLCPDQPEPLESTPPVYELYTRVDDLFIPFAPTPGRCIVNDRDDYMEYRFESGGGIVDYNDVVFHVTKTKPPIATFMPDGDGGPFRGVGQMSLYVNGEIVTGWEDFSDLATGKQLIMVGEDMTSYGINAQARHIRVSERKVIVLDYDHLIANHTEDVSLGLAAGARHLGKLNVLLGVGAVCTYLPDEVDPQRHPQLWTPDNILP
ncbi:hypothetical protein LCGC14_0015390 [marine sediment metagenome]|uniref:General secretion pathway GspH domain-containing protein n=1 Tax=marine sediment metagenome TaxID=412755 RepID=A0A0F9WF07_9ZZZZ|nr:type II secretion system protein [Phycisphaerae bacterium]HDZ43516.1 type II secretion system protein [Phycisphaerae bacterium]